MTFTTHHKLQPSSKKKHVSCPDGYMLIEKDAVNLENVASTSNPNESCKKRKSETDTTTEYKGNSKAKVKKLKEIPTADTFLASVDSADEFQDS